MELELWYHTIIKYFQGVGDVDFSGNGGGGVMLLVDLALEE